jgi:hypothetical protein
VSTGGLAVPNFGLATAAFSDCCGAASGAVSGESISDGSASANLTAGVTSSGAGVVSLGATPELEDAPNAEADTELDTNPESGTASSLPNAIGRNSCAAVASAARDPARRATDASRATSSIAPEVASRTITNADMPAAPHNAVTRSFICASPGRRLLRDLGEFWLPGRAAQCRKLLQVNFHPALLLKYNGSRHADFEGCVS